MTNKRINEILSQLTQTEQLEVYQFLLQFMPINPLKAYVNMKEVVEANQIEKGDAK